MEQPIPADLVRSTLLPLLKEIENARLKQQLADQAFQHEGQMMFVKYRLEPKEWTVDISTGVMTRQASPPMPQIKVTDLPTPDDAPAPPPEPPS